MKRAKIHGGPCALLGSVTGTAATDTTTVNHQGYYHVVSAENAGGESRDSNQAKATPNSTPINEAESDQ